MVKILWFEFKEYEYLSVQYYVPRDSFNMKDDFYLSEVQKLGVQRPRRLFLGEPSSFRSGPILMSSRIILTSLFNIVERLWMKLLENTDAPPTSDPQQFLQMSETLLQCSKTIKCLDVMHNLRSLHVQIAEIYKRLKIGVNLFKKPNLENIHFRVS